MKVKYAILGPHVADIAETDQILTPVCLLGSCELAIRPNVMHVKRFAFVLSASGATAALLLNDARSYCEPASATVRFRATHPRWGLLGLEASRRFVTVAAAESWIWPRLELPRFLCELASALLAAEYVRLDPSRVTISPHTFRGKGVGWFQTGSKLVPLRCWDQRPDVPFLRARPRAELGGSLSGNHVEDRVAFEALLFDRHPATVAQPHRGSINSRTRIDTS